MENRKEEFYKNLIISDEDRPRAERYLTSKGIEKHIILKEKLLNWIEGNEIEYSLIASTYRYDKRLRLILFKYISYLEEFYRAVLLDEYRWNFKQTKWIKEIKEKLKEFNGDLHNALERIDFYTLLIQIRSMPVRIRKKCCWPQNRFIKMNLYALKELRNAVMHNKFLLLYRGFEVCYVNGVDDGKSTNLKANILNLLNFLPSDVADSCKKDVNDAKDEGDNSGTRWNLPQNIIIDL